MIKSIFIVIEKDVSYTCENIWKYWFQKWPKTMKSSMSSMDNFVDFQHFQNHEKLLILLEKTESVIFSWFFHFVRTSTQRKEVVVDWRRKNKNFRQKIGIDRTNCVWESALKKWPSKAVVWVKALRQKKWGKPHIIDRKQNFMENKNRSESKRKL